MGQDPVKRNILIITGRYLPGWRDGGPVRSMLNLTEWMGDEYNLRIMCLDRDHGDTKRYPGIKAGEYNSVGKAKVWYTPSFCADEIASLAADSDVVYVCGPYNDYARIAMRLKRAGKITAPVLVASMGSFSPEAFKIKGLKKRLFISYMKLTHMFDDVIWSVTSAREEEELRAVIGKRCRTMIASDLPRRGITEHTGIKEEGKLKLCFISRISRKKNLAAVSDILCATEEKYAIQLDVYGNCEDKAYFDECAGKLDKLAGERSGFSWEYKGEIDGEAVPSVFAGYDAFIFPTLGENYGHVIAESLSAGCVPVISDTTPWLDLEKKDCGYVCSLGDTAAFAGALNELAAGNETEMEQKRKYIYEYISTVNEESVASSGYRRIFLLRG